MGYNIDSDLFFHFIRIFRMRDKQKTITIMEEYITNSVDYATIFFHITHTILTTLEEKHPSGRKFIIICGYCIPYINI